METTIGGDRLGSGNKQVTSFKNYERSTHDLTETFKSTMSAGTLVPFLRKISLPGDTWDIELNADVLTLPTVGPLFGSYKLQLDVFEIPLRLYNAKLHNNKLGVGMDMSQIKLPQIDVFANIHPNRPNKYDDNAQINPSCLLKYLGISGIGRCETGGTEAMFRPFNATALLAYYEIYKNYYSNKQEEIGMCIHTPGNATPGQVAPSAATIFQSDTEANILDVANSKTLLAGQRITISFNTATEEPDTKTANTMHVDDDDLTFDDVCENIEWIPTANKLVGYVKENYASMTGYVKTTTWATNPALAEFGVYSFPLSNIDDMREAILQYSASPAFTLTELSPKPYSYFQEAQGTTGPSVKYSAECSQEGLALKTYQSDLFNNWINTEWIEGENGVNELSKVTITDDSFTIDALNIAQKLYTMLNRIAVSGGTYDNWLEAVYTHERVKAIESPVYCGSLIKEIAFQEVISNAATADKPLGTLAGRGVLTQKHKGGKIIIKSNEPSIIMGIVSITPRIEYSQGNDWDVNLKSFDDLHKPAMDAIGFQDLISEQMLWSDSDVDPNDGHPTFRSIGKQPAWINYMTSVNKTYGNFAIPTDSMFMTLNRRYEKDGTGRLIDATTYIDPTKFNNIFAETSLDSQNFWVQIATNLTSRRKMSAKVIPNL